MHRPQRRHHAWHRCKESEEDAAELDNDERDEKSTVTRTGLPLSRATLQEQMSNVKKKNANQYAATFSEVVWGEGGGAASQAGGEVHQAIRPTHLEGGVLSIPIFRFKTYWVI